MRHFVLFASICLSLQVQAACPPGNMSRPALQALKTAQWKIADGAERQQLALALQDCLAAPDPELRDDLAFTALSGWMREALLERATLHQIRQTQLALLRSDSPDNPGFQRPFAALTLAEIARVDRKQPFLSADERQEMVASASAFLRGVRDYRGFDEAQGWRHGVAHGADWILQLGLNPALKHAQHDSLRAALGSQIAPPQHNYQYGEGERLAMALFYLAQRAEFSAADWQSWFAAQLAPFRNAAANTQTRLTLRHNLSGFLLPLYFMLQEAGDSAQRQKILPAVAQSLKQID